MAKRRKRTAPKPTPVEPGGPGDDPVVPDRMRYASFYEAWENVFELRRYTQQSGMPRFGLEGEDLAKANALLAEYRNG